MKYLRTLAVFVIFTLFLGCSQKVVDSGVKDGPPLANAINIDEIEEPVPWDEPKSRGGNPNSYVVFGKRYHVLNDNQGFRQRGIASWYGRKFHGQKTSNGEIFDMLAMTAAHKILPLPTFLKVTNPENNRSVIVRVNDRGPFHNNRIIDLSYAAAVKLGIYNKGTGLVEIEAITHIPNGTPPRSANATAANRKVYIQLGAFSEKANAAKLQISIAKLNVRETRIIEGLYEEKPVFRVQVGPIHSAAEANQLTNKLSGLGIESRFVFEEDRAEDHMIQCC